MEKNSELLYSTEQLIKDIETVSEITNRFINIIWCEQNSDFNFDKLPKSEQIQLIGLHKDAGMLENSLKMYKSWFRNK